MVLQYWEMRITFSHYWYAPKNDSYLSFLCVDQLQIYLTLAWSISSSWLPNTKPRYTRDFWKNHMYWNSFWNIFIILFKTLLQLCNVLFQCFTEHENGIKKYYNKWIEEWFNYIIYQPHKSCKCVTQLERHN